MATIGLGMALGAGAMYVLDPETGARRRREVLRATGSAAMHRLRPGAARRDVLVAGKRAARRVEALAANARAGYLAGRQDP